MPQVNSVFTNGRYLEFVGHHVFDVMSFVVRVYNELRFVSLILVELLTITV